MAFEGKKRSCVNSGDVSNSSNSYTMSHDLKSRVTGLQFSWCGGSFGCCSQKPKLLDQQRQWPQHEKSVGKDVKVTLEKDPARAPPCTLYRDPYQSPCYPNVQGFPERDLPVGHFFCLECVFNLSP